MYRANIVNVKNAFKEFWRFQVVNELEDDQVVFDFVSSFEMAQEIARGENIKWVCSLTTQKH